MTIWILLFALVVLIGMIIIKGVENARGKDFFFSKKLRLADDTVVPKARSAYLFFLGRGDMTLSALFLSIPHRLGARLTSLSHYIEKKIEAINNSSRGKRSLNEIGTPRSEFLKTISDYKEKDKEETTKDLQ
ncbi:MAG: hypothetical protein AAB587_01555 [Patescibacteria group bacterium]